MTIKKYEHGATIDEKLKHIWNAWFTHVDDQKGMGCTTSFYAQFHEKFAGSDEIFDVADEDVNTPPSGHMGYALTSGIRSNER